MRSVWQDIGDTQDQRFKFLYVMYLGNEIETELIPLAAVSVTALHLWSQIGGQTNIVETVTDVQRIDAILAVVQKEGQAEEMGSMAGEANGGSLSWPGCALIMIRTR